MKAIIVPIKINKIPEDIFNSRTLMDAKKAASVIKMEKKIKICMVPGFNSSLFIFHIS